jgi:hypothetical protein
MQKNNRLQMRNQLSALIEDRYVENDYLIALLRQALTYPEVIIAIEGIIKIQSRTGCDIQQIQAQLEGRLGGFVLFRDGKPHIANEAMENLLGHLAPIIASFIRLGNER